MREAARGSYHNRSNFSFNPPRRDPYCQEFPDTNRRNSRDYPRRESPRRDPRLANVSRELDQPQSTFGRTYQSSPSNRPRQPSPFGYRSSPARDDRACYICGSSNHLKRDCPRQSQGQSSSSGIPNPNQYLSNRAYPHSSYHQSSYPYPSTSSSHRPRDGSPGRRLSDGDRREYSNRDGR